jgi:hypothetical protein
VTGAGGFDDLELIVVDGAGVPQGVANVGELQAEGARLAYALLAAGSDVGRVGEVLAAADERLGPAYGYVAGAALTWVAARLWAAVEVCRCAGLDLLAEFAPEVSDGDG